MLVAIDFGKAVNYGYFCNPNGEEYKVFTIRNNRQKYNLLYSKIGEFKDKWGLEEIFVGYESSGQYVEPLVHYLAGKGSGDSAGESIHAKRVKELTGNSPNKSDLNSVYKKNYSTLQAVRM
jgi:hypothetical protein